MSPIVRKLSALGFLSAFDASDRTQLRTLVVWLEETKIRHLPVAERAPLRDINSSQWPHSFHAYLTALQCPHQLELSALESLIIIDWLLSRAVSLMYHDGAEELNKINATTTTKRVSRLVSLDTASHQFLAALQALAKALKLPTEGFDTDTLLKGVCDVIDAKFSPHALAAAARADSTALRSTNEETLGFTTGDAVVDRAAVLLRLLYLADLRQMQTEVNSVLAWLQERTANPRVDSSLGRVGV